MNRQTRRAHRVAQLQHFAVVPSITTLTKNIEALPESDDIGRKEIQDDFSDFWDTVNKTYRKLRDDVHVNLGQLLEDLGTEITNQITEIMQSLPEEPEEGAEEEEAATPAAKPMAVSTVSISQHADRIERLMRTIVQNCNNLIRSMK